MAPVWPVTAPPRRPPTRGLIAQATPHPPPDTAGARWEAGISWQPEPCGRETPTAAVCEHGGFPDPDRGNGDSPTLTPVLLTGTVVCTTMDPASQADASARAVRKLHATRSAQLEEAFWTGTGHIEGDDPVVLGPHLADGTGQPLADSPVDPLTAIMLLDQGLTDCLDGGTGIIHLTPAHLALLSAGDLLHQDTDGWHTPAGHLVIAGAGYTGGGARDPDTGTLPAAPDPLDPQWVWATGPVHVLLGAETGRWTIDHHSNDRGYRAEQAGAAFFDPCCHLGVQVQPPTGGTNG